MGESSDNLTTPAAGIHCRAWRCCPPAMPEMTRSPSDCSIDEWQERHWPLIDRNEYKLTKFLGRGSYAAVSGAICQITKKEVAIKKIDHVFCNISDAKRILREVAILCRARHPNIVKLENCVYNPANMRDLYLVLEYVSSDLGKLISSGNQLFEEHLKCIWLQLLAALNYFHSAGLIHRDIKPENVLISPQCEVKLCDFGLSRSIEQVEASAQGGLLSPSPQPSASQNSSMGGTPAPAPALSLQRQMTQHVVTRWYRAPELILRKRNYTTAIDVWSTACVIAELLPLLSANSDMRSKRKVLFPGRSSWGMSPSAHSGPAVAAEDDFKQNGQMMVIFDKMGTPNGTEIAKIADTRARHLLERLPQMTQTPMVELYPGAPEGAANLIQSMLEFDDETRCTITQAIQNEYFTQCMQDPERFGDMEQRIKLVAAAPINLEFESEKYPTERFVKREMVREMEAFLRNKPAPTPPPAERPEAAAAEDVEPAAAEDDEATRKRKDSPCKNDSDGQTSKDSKQIRLTSPTADEANKSA